MKKLLMSSAVLLFFSVSMVLFQMSCSKEAVANPNNSTSKIAYIVVDRSNSDVYTTEIWTANIDGTNQTKVFTLPANLSLLESYNGAVDITSDGSKIVFVAVTGDLDTGWAAAVYSINADGTGFTQISQTVNAASTINAVSAQ